MNNDNEIRLFLMNHISRQRIRDLMICPGDIVLMQHIAAGYNTSGKIAVMLDIAVQSVSARLMALYRKGYVTRKEVQQESGGYEFEYTNVYKVPEDAENN